MIQNCWEVWDCNEREKTEENRQISILLTVISSERLWWALNTKSVKCCSLTLQFSNNLWSWRVDFSLALKWEAEKAQSANQNQRCNSLALCVDNKHRAIARVQEREIIGEQEQTAASSEDQDNKSCQQLFHCCHLRLYQLHFIALQSGFGSAQQDFSLLS